MTEMESLYAHKCIFLTGGSGFFGKAILEKLLRSIPTISKIFVLLRPKKGVQPIDRLQTEIIQSRIFDRLRSERPNDFEAFILSKVVAIPGDITSPTLGLSSQDAQYLKQHIHISIHAAATVSFNEPLDVATDMNCLGALHILQFLQQCDLNKLLCHVHISTAYVNSNLRQHIIQEQLYPLEFQAEDALNAITNASSSELEKLHANLMGTYPNTYALTKSMAEHLLVERNKTTNPIPLILFRPTIIGAAWKEPVPGWIDQIAAAGAIFMAAGLGVLTLLPGNPRNVADIVPVDMAVNALLLSIAHKMQLKLAPNEINGPNQQLFQQNPTIIHSGTSDVRQNPLRWRIPIQIVPEYFRKNPPLKKLFVSKFQMIPTPQTFQLLWFLSYSLPSSIYSTVANLSGHSGHIRDAARLGRLTWRARMLVELFKPFTESEWEFRSDALIAMARSMPADTTSSTWWGIQAQEISWDRYVFNFCVGLKKFMLHEDVLDVDIEGVTHTELALSTDRMLEWDSDHHAISFPGLFPDISWAYISSRKPGYTKEGIFGRLLGWTGWKEGKNHEATYVPSMPIPGIVEVRNAVLESIGVRNAVLAVIKSTGNTPQDVEQQALEILNVMAAQIDYKSVRKLGWFLRKLCRRMYERIDVDEKRLIALRQLMIRAQAQQLNASPLTKNSAVVLIPTHRSYVDFLLLSYVFFAYNIPVPHIAAGQDFLSLGAVTKLLRESGAFFMRRSFRHDELYSAIFENYTQYLLQKGFTVEFFMEGTRSRSGKQLTPKLGILRTVVQTFLSQQVENLYLVPVTIDYEKPLEVLLHQNELLGEGKVKESLGALFKSFRFLRQNFGSISVQFGDPIDLKQYMRANESHYDQHNIMGLINHLAYDLSDAMISNATCMPSHLVATLLLMYRHGISMTELVQQTKWLRSEILYRGGVVKGTQGRLPESVVDHALDILQELVIRRRKERVEPKILTRDDYPNMIGLGYYRNKILHWFHREGVLACAIHSFSILHDDDSALESINIPKTHVIQEALFLYELLRMEFIRKDCSNDKEHLEVALQQLQTRAVLSLTPVPRNAVANKLNDVNITILRPGHHLYSFLCTLIWPFVDSYYVTISSFLALRPQADIEEEDLVKRVQWLAETMYHEQLISFYESCALETISNAITMFEIWKVVERFVHPKTSKRMIRLCQEFQAENERLEDLVVRMAKFRKPPHKTAQFYSQVLSPSLSLSQHPRRRERQLIAQLPLLSKI